MSSMSIRGVRWLTLLLALTACDHFGAGVSAYRQGRDHEALTALAAAEARAGDCASAELLYDRALAALRVSRLREAEWSMEKAVVRNPDFARLRDFLAGNLAFVRCARAEAETLLTDPDPTAFARAIAHAQSARYEWARAATGASDWPAARRNAERATRKLQELETRRAEAEQDRRAQRERQPESVPEAATSEEHPPGQEIERLPAPAPDPDLLTATQVDALLEQLAAKEAEKLALRSARRELRSPSGGRDW